MKNIAAIFLGHSHLAAMIPYLFDRPVGTESTPPITHYVFDTSTHNVFVNEGGFKYSLEDNGQDVLNPAILAMADQLVGGDSERVYISMFGGNSHNGLTLLQPDQKFDFVLPSEPDLPLLEGAEILPYDAIRAVIEDNARSYLKSLRGLKNSVGDNVYHIISPPPIQSDDYVRDVIDNDGYFAAFAVKNITPSTIRYKTWVLHSELFRSVCREIGVNIIEPPVSATVDQRWLAPDCIGADPTHGSKVYGGRVLEEIETSLGGHYAGWAWLK